MLDYCKMEKTSGMASQSFGNANVVMLLTFSSLAAPDSVMSGMILYIALSSVSTHNHDWSMDRFLSMTEKGFNQCHWGNNMIDYQCHWNNIVVVTAKKSLRLWLNESHEIKKNNDVTTTKQNTT